MTQPQFTRRSALRSAVLAGLASGAGLFPGRLAQARPRKDGAPPRATILLWLDGGPSHLDTFDPKPGARTGGPTRAIQTRVPGLQLAEHFPALAERANHLAVVRGLSSREGDHTRGRYLLHTGFTTSTTIHHPAWGSVLAAKAAHTTATGSGDVPPFVAVGPRADLVGAGYLGAAHAAYGVRPGQAGALAGGQGRSAASATSRRRLLRLIEEPFARAAGLDPAPGGETGSARTAAYARAERLMAGPLRGALDLRQESARVRARYGEGPTGRAVLSARRLVEAGVRCVEVRLGGWDDHQNLFDNLPGRARALDQAFGALLDDLAARGRLDRTLILCLGEFGRTPDVNGRGGRDHYPRAFSAVLAGGGVRGGQAVGATCPEGREVVQRPVSVADLYATLATLEGLDPAATRYAGERPITVVDGGTVVQELVTS
jgi:uncharacterized protein (DUF1501 family)